MIEIIKKLCTKCKIEKDISKFELRSDTGKYRGVCRECISKTKNKEKSKAAKKKYYEKNKEKILKRNKENYPTIKEKRKNNSQQFRRYEENYRKENIKELREYRNEYKKSRRKNDPIYKLKQNIGNLTRNAFTGNGYKKNSLTNKVLNCSFEEFKLYIELKFESWMNWDNYGKYNGKLNYGWDLDHIIPISSAHLEKDIYELSNYKNFQPLCSKINRDIKRNKIL